jgi:aminotransferase EvaB
VIKFWSYKREYKKNKNSIIKLINSSLNSGATFFGKNLINFEKNFLKKNKSKYGCAVGSGTDAILIALISIGIKKGDEVITVSNTAIPTISAIISSGATPVLVDANIDDYLINPNLIEEKITSKTKAIIPVHLYGQAADMKKIINIAKKYKLKVIEDCAQAQGAKYKGELVGTMGDFGCFSFYPTKILGAYGDGGFITVKNKISHDKIKRIRFYGIESGNKSNRFNKKYYANEYGINSRIDEIQSAILNYKLKKVSIYIKRRREIAKIYKNRLVGKYLILPKENSYNFHVYHLFTLYHKKSKNIIEQLNKNKIETRKIYPYPINQMKGFKKYKFNKRKYLISEKLSKNIFCLPLYPEMKNNEILYICKKLNEIIKKING